MESVDSSSTFVRSPGPLAAEVDGEVVMLEPSTSRYFGLADTAVRIWQLLDEPRSVDGIVDALLDEYDVDRETCEAEVIEFISQLADAGLVVRSTEDG